MSATASPTAGAGHRFGRACAAVAALLAVGLLGGAAGAVTASAQPTPTPSPSAPEPPSSSASQQPGPPPCQGRGCIPQPATPAPPPSGNQPGQPSGQTSPQESSCGITDIPACVNDAIDSFFRDLVTPALNSLLDLLANTLLTTPTLDQLPRIGELWNSSWQLMLTCYGILILIGGITVMAYETLQTRTSVKEILPRIVIGFLAGMLSLWVSSQAINLANALAQAIMSGGVDEESSAETLKKMVMGSLNGGFFIIFIGLFLAGMLVALLLTYIVRVALTVILIVGAPLALMFHALPQTEGIAKWWWKAFAGCLAIQLGQSLTLITAMLVFLAPGGFTFFGPTTDGLVNLLVALALMYILVKIPFWVLGSIRGGGGSFLGSLVRGFLAYKTFGLLGGRGGGSAPTPRGGPRPSGPADPYAKTRATASGQYMLPLERVRRQRASKPPPQRSNPKPAPPPRPSGQGTQLALPVDGEWPEHKPRLGRDGQYELPLDVPRHLGPTRPAGSPPQPRSSASGSHGRQRRFPASGQLPDNQPRLSRDGRYRLPPTAHRVRRPTPAPPPPEVQRPSMRGRQLTFPSDGQWPEHKPRLGPDGQYQLPLDVQRTRNPARSGSEPPPTPPPPRPKRARPPRQHALPLDLPKVSPPRPSTRREGGEPK
ncbi:hypothetical protein GCM10012275_59550 [Longimycelium tulufanense]|uniref:Uncharacterized protein n=1 Tax=Longimycelium tulufanense TaxID=907463 RepID=A0A8J3CI76_9PSEU|nr:hypothetical protein [Longimycelium tulufanense]GGM80995.1 hypothetical protein GCM10012275_59550 [Longimycelium tulufanense]